MKRHYWIAVAIAAAALSAGGAELAAQAAETGSITGVVVGPDDRPVRRAFVQYQVIPAASGLLVGGRRANLWGQAPTDSAGRFLLTGLKPASYRLCVEAGGTNLLNPCRWGPPPAPVVIAPAALNVTGHTIKLQAGVAVRVVVDDPDRHLDAVEGGRVGALLIGAQSAPPHWQPSRLVVKTPARREYELVVPYGTTAKLQLHSRRVRLADEAGAALEAEVVDTAVHRTPAGPNPPVKFKVTGRR